MKYQKIDPNMYSADELLALLKKSYVLLEIRIDTFDFICSVTSYAYTTRGLYVYQPSHCLMELDGTGEERARVRNSVEWTEKLSSDKAWIGIDNEFYFECEYSNDLTQIKVLLSQLEVRPHETELYLSNDFANFYGPLECDFIEWWIKNHKGYHTDTIATQIDDFYITENGTLLDYTGKDAEIVKVPSGVKRIGVGAFRFCKAKQIILPEGVVSIEAEAFNQSRILENVHIPISVVQIGESAFAMCNSLTEVRIPPSVKHINSYTFSDCRMLKHIRLPESLETIGQKAFQGCQSLEKLQIPKYAKRIDSYAFSGCSRLKQVSIPEKISVGFAAFEGCPSNIENLAANFLVVKGKLLKTSKYLKGDIKLPNSVHTLVTDPNRDVFLGSDTLYDNTKIRTLLLPKGVITAERRTLPRELEYLIVQPGKRNFICYDDILDNANTKIIFHFGRNIILKSSYRWCDEPLIFVAFSADKVLLHPHKDSISNNDRYYRVIVQDENDIKKIVETYHLSEISMIINYLTDILGCGLI